MELLAPAKLTLSLRITGVRDDGYHLIDAEMVALDLADRLEIDPDGEGVVVEGRSDDVSTDAIIPGEFCHLTASDEIGRAAFHYVRPDFGERIGRGETILVAGDGWGSGSSREHAAFTRSSSSGLGHGFASESASEKRASSGTNVCCGCIHR